MIRFACTLRRLTKGRNALSCDGTTEAKPAGLPTLLVKLRYLSFRHFFLPTPYKSYTEYTPLKPHSYHQGLPLVMRSTRSLLILLCGIILAVSADNKNYFTSPASNNGINPVYTIGDDLLVSWVTELGVFNVTIWQESLVQQSAASQGNIYCKSRKDRKRNRSMLILSRF